MQPEGCITFNISLEENRGRGLVLFIQSCNTFATKISREVTFNQIRFLAILISSALTEFV